MPHKRYYIRKSDKTTAGRVVTEGLAGFTMDDKLAAFDTASVWCPVCKVEGQIAIVGPRRPFTLPNNREIAMEGDLCLCQCTPPPRLLASQDVAWMQFENDELARMGYAENGLIRSAYDEQFTLRDHHTGQPLAHKSYRITSASGQIIQGITDANGTTQRVTTASQAEGLALAILHP